MIFKIYINQMTQNQMIIVLTLLMVITTVEGIKFNFELEGYAKRCFSELLTEATPFHFRAEAQTEDFQITLNHHDGTNLVINKRSERMKKIDSYASVTGEYFFCIQSTTPEIHNYTFNLFQGLELSDLGSLPKEEDSKLIDELVDKINQMYQRVAEQEVYSHKVNEYNMELQKLVSFKSVGFVFLSVTVVFVISFLHYLEIKRVLKNRKII